MDRITADGGQSVTADGGQSVTADGGQSQQEQMTDRVSNNR